MMPRLDGITTCEQLRANPDTADLFILLLSGGDYHERGLKAGANVVMEKPMNASSLIEILQAIPAT
jgi:CheY-like chemotaxis protein